jgi:hypothetical protein
MPRGCYIHRVNSSGVCCLRSQEADIAKTKRALVTVLQSLRQSVSGRDRFQRDAQVLQGTIERETEEFELEFKHRVDVRTLCYVMLDV